jgi:hypothetical protein
MIGLLIVLVSFFMAGTGFLGRDLIYALDILENWYYFIGIIILFIALVILFSFTIRGASIGSDISNGNVLGGFGGATLGYFTGSLISILMFLKIGVQIWLVTWLMGSIDPSIVDFDGLKTKEMLALGVLVVMAFVNNSGSKN